MSHVSRHDVWRPFGSGLVLLAILAVTGCSPAPASSVDATGSPSSGTGLGGTPGSSGPGSGADESTTATVTASVFAGGVISTDDEEYRITMSADGRVAYFARASGFFPQTRQAAIMETRLVDGVWTTPAVAPFSGEFPDIDPWLSPDGNELYFSSIRPVSGEARRDAELFRVDREGDGWSEPVHLTALGSESDELGASVTEDGEIWFASDRPGGAGGWDLYRSTPSGDGFAAPEPIEDLNSTVWEFNPAIAADGSIVVFTSIDRDGGPGLGDLYVSRRDGDRWAEARPLLLNTSADEYHASLSVDGATLYFVRRTTDGDLYQVDWSIVDPG